MVKAEFFPFGGSGKFSGTAMPTAAGTLGACPFCCGYGAVVRGGRTAAYRVHCPDCKADGPRVAVPNGGFSTTPATARRNHLKAMSAAVRAWNERL